MSPRKLAQTGPALECQRGDRYFLERVLRERVRDFSELYVDRKVPLDDERIDEDYERALPLAYSAAQSIACPSIPTPTLLRCLSKSALLKVDRTSVHTSSDSRGETQSMSMESDERSLARANEKLHHVRVRIECVRQHSRREQTIALVMGGHTADYSPNGIDREVAMVGLELRRDNSTC